MLPASLNKIFINFLFFLKITVLSSFIIIKKSIDVKVAFKGRICKDYIEMFVGKFGETVRKAIIQFFNYFFITENHVQPISMQ